MAMDCPTKYKYHYIDRIRPQTIGGALLWGSAMDKALEALVHRSDYKQVFLKYWSTQEINAQETNLKHSINIAYSNYDFDFDLLEKEDIKDIKEAFSLEKKEIEDKLERIYEQKNKWGLDNLAEDSVRFLNFVIWHCLKNKGFILLEEVKEKILPDITEVLGTQVKIELTNSDGDGITGYVDLVAKYKNIDKPIIFDFKTSSREYERDAVLTSPQLTLYVYGLTDKYDTRTAGFIVLNKQLNKKTLKECIKCGKNGTGQRHKTCDNIIDDERCNGKWKLSYKFTGSIQVLINEVSDQMESIVLENFEMVNKMVKQGIFYRNLKACKKQYGKTIITCAYYDKCHNNEDKGLVKV